MYDAIVIGGGIAGYNCALKVVELGGKVVLIDKSELGGTCTNYGCIPTKAMQASAKVIDKIKKSKKYGINVNNFSIDFKEIIARKDRIVKTSVLGIKSLLENKVEVIKGEGRIVDKNKVEVNDKVIEGKNIVIATGSKAVKLENIDGLTNEEILNLEEVPKKLLIIGGGAVGVEFGCIFNRFGSEVTIVEMLVQIIPSEEKEIAEELRKIMEKDGIRIFTNAKVEYVKDGEALIKTNEGEIKEEFNKTLIAVGRRANFDKEELDKLGVKYNKKGIKVNKQMQTNIPNIYAVGDVTGEMQLAHYGLHQGIVAAENIMGNKSKISRVVPNCIYTIPEIASVGKITENVKKANYAANGKARTLDEVGGWIKVYFEKDKIVGCSIIGEDATELIAEVTFAIQNKVSVKDIKKTIHAHPTLAELFFEAIS